MDPGGCVQRARASVAGLGDVRVPPNLLPLLCLSGHADHWPGRPHQHGLERPGMETITRRLKDPFLG